VTNINVVKQLDKTKKIKFKRVILKADGRFHELEEDDEIDVGNFPE